MATTEDVLSQEFEETAEGVTILRIFSSTYTDYNTGSALFRSIPYQVGHPFPYRIGDALNYDSLSFPVTTQKTAALRVTHISVRGVDAENIKVEVFYSTAIPTVVQKMQPDTNASWEENFSISSVQADREEWRQDSASALMDRFMTREDRGGALQKWSDRWAADGTGGTAPDLVTYEPNWTFSPTTYSRTLHINRILTFQLSVNNEDWMFSYFKNLATRNGSQLLGSEPGLADTDWSINDLILYPSFSPESFVLGDVGKWLFTGCNVSRVRFDSYQYDWEFVFSPKWKWNEPHGVAIDLYPSVAFSNLYIGMTNAPQNQNQQGARE